MDCLRWRSLSMSHLQVVARAKEEFGRQRAWWIGVVDHESEGHFYLAHNKVICDLKVGHYDRAF